MPNDINYFSFESIKQQLHNNINVELLHESAFSLPVVKKNDGKILESMFIYRDVPDGCSEGFLRRPYAWIITSAADGRVLMYADCKYMDFVDTEIYPFDMQIFVGMDDFNDSEAYQKKCAELFDEYESLKPFVFKEDSQLTETELKCRSRFVKLFKDIVCIGHYPFYRALSPEFFMWLGLSEKDESDIEKENKNYDLKEEENTANKNKIKDGHEAENAENKEDNKEENVIVVDISEITEKLEVLEKLFCERISYDEYKEKLFDNMHKELQSYKNGFFSKMTETLELDIIKVIEDVMRSVSAYRDKNPSSENYVRLLSVVEGIEMDLKDVLYRQNIEPYSVAGDVIDVVKQKIISVIETDEKEKDKKLCRRLAPGYEKNGQVLRPEKITAYVYGSK